MEGGTKVDVEALADEYKEFPPDVLGSTRFELDALGRPPRSRFELSPPFPGDGTPGDTLPSLSFAMVRVLGFEKSFILELLLFDSFSGGRVGAGPERIVCEFGDGNGFRPLGKAAFAAVAAARFPPSVPLMYGKPPVEDTCGLWVPLVCRMVVPPAVIMGARPGYDRLRSLAWFAGGKTWCMAACAAICEALRPLLLAVAWGRDGSKKP